MKFRNVYHKLRPAKKLEFDKAFLEAQRDWLAKNSDKIEVEWTPGEPLKFDGENIQLDDDNKFIYISQDGLIVSFYYNDVSHKMEMSYCPVFEAVSKRRYKKTQKKHASFLNWVNKAIPDSETDDQ